MNGLLRQFRRWLQRSAEGRRARQIRAAHVGPHSYVHPSVQVFGWRQVRIGHHSVISEDTWLNVNDRGVEEAVIVIGDNCFLGRRNFFSPGTFIKIGDYCLTGVDCHFLGADHVHSSPFVPYTMSGTAQTEAIELGPNCWLGASVTVLKGVKIGHGSIIGAASVLTRDVPPFSMVVGNPGRVIRRFDSIRKEWVSVAEYPEDGDSHSPSEVEYLEMLRKSHPAIKLPVIASGKGFGDLA